MIYTKLTKEAIRIAFDAHKEQTDKTGLPYIFHPFHLAEQMDTEEETIIALLHDVVEDTDITLDELRSYGFSDAVMDALSLLTHDDGVEYMDYIKRIKFNTLAKKVKLADLRHNSNQTRLGFFGNESLQRLVKYKKAILMLYDFPERESDAEPLYRKRISLDKNRLWFLSIFKNKSRFIVKYSFDVEKAGDSHYELPAEEYNRLAAHFGSGDTIDHLREWIDENNESDFVCLLDRLEIFYQPFHYD